MVNFRLFYFFMAAFPPSVPAFLLVVPPHKKSSTQVGLLQFVVLKIINQYNSIKITLIIHF